MLLIKYMVLLAPWDLQSGVKVCDCLQIRSCIHFYDIIVFNL